MRPHFTIRTLLLGTLLVACICGGTLWHRRSMELKRQRRQEALVWLKERAGPISYSGSNQVYSVNLNRQRIDESTWYYLVSLNDAHAVRLDETNLNGTDLRRFSRFKNLKLLSLHNTRVADDHLPLLLPNSNLEDLYLAGTDVTSAGVPTMRQFRKLLNLNIANTKIDDAAVPVLIQMKQLQRLNANRTCISADGLHQLRNALPNCKIVPYRVQE